MQSSEIGKLICEELATLLLPLGYKRESFLFSRPSEDLIHLIQLQGSRSNTAALSKHTVNVAVWVPALSPEEKLSVPGAHWQNRLGSLCHERTDLWWQSSSAETAGIAASEITSRDKHFALPSLAELANSRALLSLWQSGLSPGLTQFQATRFCGALEASLA